MRKQQMRPFSLVFLIVLSILFCRQVCGGQVHVLVDQVGYETQAPKQAVVEGTGLDHPREFALVDAASGKTVFEAALQPSGKVHAWDNWVFWTADFSAWRKPGRYALKVRADRTDVTSCPFEINDDLLERDTLSDVIYYFKGQRASGLMDEADRHLQLPGGQQGSVDVHGGWYDATGDYGIHLSHQNPTSYFN